MSTDDAKIVQTELPRDEYERLRQVADQEGKPLKQVLRQAAKEYGDRHLAYDPTDPLFSVEPADGEIDTDAREIDELLADSVRSATDVNDAHQ